MECVCVCVWIWMCCACPSCSSLCGDEPFCRICHEGGSVEELLSPCECSGSLAMVHRGCLEHWLTASNTSRCELCHFQFALERLPKPLTEVRERERELDCTSHSSPFKAHKSHRKPSITLSPSILFSLPLSHSLPLSPSFSLMC